MLILNFKIMKTTREEVKENIHANVTNKLQELLTRTYDAESGYKKAMEKTESGRLSSFFKPEPPSAASLQPS